MRSIAVGCVIVAVAVAAAACGDDGDPRSREPRRDAIPLRRMPPADLDKCLSSPQTRAACPALVPVVDEGVFHRAMSFSDRAGTTFFAEWNAPRPGLTRRNAPPGFAHLVVQGGDVDALTGGFRWPTSSARSTDGRGRARGMGERDWNGRRGELVLAPRFPVGGINGDHLMFRWGEGSAEYLISLHAWRPLAETEATLRAVVASIPAPEG